MSMHRVKLRWSGFPGGPGYSSFYFSWNGFGELSTAQLDTMTTKVGAFATAIKGMVPSTVSFTVMNDVEEFSPTDGAIIRVGSATAIAPINSTASSTLTYSAASGAVITWRTNGVRKRRRVRGRTFLVPLHGQAYASDGTLDGGYITTINSAATALRTPTADYTLNVWCRPSGPGATDGDTFPIASHTIPDMAAILRSRRD